MTISLATGGMISDLTFTGVINRFPVTINGVKFPPLVTFKKDKPLFQFTIKGSDGNAFSLAAPGSEIRFTGKLNLADSDADAVFSKLCAITDAIGGVCEVSLTQAETNFTGVKDRIIIVELEYKDTVPGNLQTLAQGELTINADVRQST